MSLPRRTKGCSKRGAGSLVSLIVTVFALNHPALSQVPVKVHSQPELALDRLSLTFRGVLATDKEKLDFLSSRKSFDDFLEDLKSKDRAALESELAWFYTESLRIDRAPNVFELGGPADSARSFFERRISTEGARNPYFDGPGAIGVYALAGLNFGQGGNANTESLLNTALWCNSGAGAPISTAKPWWSNTGQTINICTSNIAACGGTNLNKCYPWNKFVRSDFGISTHEDDFTPLLVEHFALEPGYLIAKTITEDKPWENILKSTSSPISGTMEFFANQDYGAGLYKKAPVGTYLDSEKKTLLTRKTDPFDTSWRWVERGPSHAGVLTTPAFQSSFNGWRAKANGAMEAFLCRKFVPPVGVSALATADQYELMRRPYCSSCHVVLEPLSDFFRRWENVGDSIYEYKKENLNTPTGSFNGMTDSDLPGLARVFSQQEDFGSCAVKKAFSFVTRREMVSEETANLLPSLVAAYKNNGHNIWKVMKQIALSEVLLGERVSP